MEVENAQHVWHSYDDDRWKAGAGTTALGIIGTVIGGLGLAGGMGGLLGGGLGNKNNNCNEQMQEIMTLKAQLAKMQGEKYTDLAVHAQKDETIAMNEKLYGFIMEQDKKLYGLENKLGCLQKQIQLSNQNYDERLANQANLVNMGLTNANNAIQALATTVNSFTKVYIPSTSVCNSGCGCSCASAVQQ